MFVLRSTCFQTPFHVCAQTHIFLGSLPMCFQIYMPMCSLPCLCLDLHAYVFFAMFMLITTCLCVTFHVYAQICKLVLRSVCLCASCHACVLRSLLAVMPCATLALCLLKSLFLAFWPFRWGVDLDPTVQAYIKGFGSFPFAFDVTCLLLCFISMLASLDLGFVMLPHGLMLVWLHPSFNYCLLNSIFHLLKSLFLNFSFDSLYRFLNLYHLKFYSVTLFNLSSTSTIPLPF